MGQAVVVIDRVADMADWDQASFADGQLVKWDAAAGKFTAAPPSAGGGDSTYVHDQVVPATTWTINHNLGKVPSITVVDSAGSEVEGAIQHPSANQALAIFRVAFAGKAYAN